jgi:hypothetical protein
MPSLPASAVGCAIGIADADKVGIATIAQAARLIKSKRRMGSLLVRPQFSWRWMNAFQRGEFHEEQIARIRDGHENVGWAQALVRPRCDCLETAAPSGRAGSRSAYWLRGGR